VDFGGEVFPIFRSRCFSCHGPDKQKGDLRLDQPEFIALGGHTGSPILGRTLEESELFSRIRSADPKYRMPAEGAPLSEAQIETLRRWIVQGGNWGSLPGVGESVAGGERWVLWADPYLKPIERLFGYIRPIAIPLVLFLAAVLWIERAKRRVRTSRYESVAAEGMAVIRREWYLIVPLMLVLIALWLHHRQKMADMRQAIRQLEANAIQLADQNEAPVRRTPDGGPIPPRPKHPKRLGGTYYRGNDEHDPRLYNGGFYRTATLRVDLADAAGRSLSWGDRVGDGELFVRLEIARAKQATPHLFTEAIMRTIFLSRQIALLNHPEMADDPVWLECVEAGERWQASYPIRPDPGALACSGMIYVYKGHAENGEVDGKFHYGISYDVQLLDGAIAGESEIWMGSLAAPNTLLIPRADQMALDEWFDFRPLPEIEGVNATDPALLGVPEYADSTVGREGGPGGEPGGK
jgi:hypothetical protein